MRRKIKFISLLFLLFNFNAIAQKDTSFVSGDTLYQYNFTKKGKLFSIQKDIQGQDYETYSDIVYFNESGDTSSVFFENKLDDLTYSLYRNKYSNKLLSNYKIQKNKHVFNIYNKQGEISERKMFHINQFDKQKSCSIIEKYENEILVSSDTTFKINKPEKSSKPKIYRFRQMDTIYIQDPNIKWNDSLNSFQASNGRIFRNFQFNYFVDSLIRSEIKKAPQIYYLKGIKNYTESSKEGLYRKGHIPYQGFWRFNQIDTIDIYYPIFKSEENLNFRQKDSIYQSLKNRNNDSLRHALENKLTRKYYFREREFYGKVSQEGKFKTGQIPIGNHIEYCNCHFSTPAIKTYKEKGSYNRKGEKDGIWKTYTNCDGKFRVKQYFKNGKLMWTSCTF